MWPFNRRNKDTANDELTRLVGQQELVRLTTNTVNDLASVIEDSYRGCQLIPVKLYPSSNGKGYSGFIGSGAKISSCQAHNDALEINVGSRLNLGTTLYYGSDNLVSFFSDIHSPTDPYTHCGLYLRREGAGSDAESLLLKIPFCEENLPKVYNQFQIANKYRKSVCEVAASPKSYAEPTAAQEDDSEWSILLPWLPIPVWWISKKGVSPMIPNKIVRNKKD